MKWRKEVLQFIVRKGEAHYEEIRRGVSPGHLVPTSTLTDTLNDLANTGFIVVTNRGSYRPGSDAERALEILEYAEGGNAVPYRRGEEALIGRMFQAHLLRQGRKTVSVIEPNPEHTHSMHVGTVIRLTCGHTVPSASPWPGEITCLECGRVFEFKWTPFVCVCGEPRDVKDYVDGNRFYCLKCGKIWEVKGGTIKQLPLPPVVFPGAVTLAESIFPILSSRPLQLFRGLTRNTTAGS